MSRKSRAGFRPHPALVDPPRGLAGAASLAQRPSLIAPQWMGGHRAKARCGFGPTLSIEEVPNFVLIHTLMWTAIFAALVQPGVPFSPEGIEVPTG